MTSLPKRFKIGQENSRFQEASPRGIRQDGANAGTFGTLDDILHFSLKAGRLTSDRPNRRQ